MRHGREMNLSPSVGSSLMAAPFSLENECETHIVYLLAIEGLSREIMGILGPYSSAVLL